MSDRNYQRLMLGIASVVLLIRCVTFQEPKRPTWKRGLGHESPHVILTAETYTPAQWEYFNVNADVVGDFGSGNVICLTPEWLVDAVGIALVDQQQCGHEFTFRHPYRFRFNGEYRITVTVRYRSGAVFDVKSINVQVGG